MLDPYSASRKSQSAIPNAHHEKMLVASVSPKSAKLCCAGIMFEARIVVNALNWSCIREAGVSAMNN